MKSILLCLLMFTATACSPRGELVKPQLINKPEPVQWQYETFSWSRPDYNEHRQMEHCILTIRGVRTNKTYRLEEVFNWIGERGWEYAAFDGKEYLVKRKKADWPEDHFSVIRYEDAKMPDVE